MRTRTGHQAISFDGLIDSLPTAALVVDFDGRIMYANPCFSKLVGRSIHRLIGLPLFELTQDSGPLVILLSRARSAPATAGLTLNTANGPYHAQASANLIHGGESDSIGVHVTEPGLGLNANLSSTILDHATEAIVVCDQNGKIMNANPAAHRLAGRDPIACSFDFVFPLRQACEDASLADRRELIPFEQISGPDAPGSVAACFDVSGVSKRVLVSAGPLQRPAGETYGTVVTLTDITRQYAAEKALRAGEKRYRLLVEQASEGICLISSEGRILDANPGLAKMLGVPVPRLVGKDIEEVEFLADLTRSKALLSEDGGFAERTLEGEIRRPNGRITAEGTCTQLPNKNLLVVIRDVTERQLVEQEILRISEREERRIGRELYDLLAQQLAGIGFLTKVLEQRLKSRGQKEFAEAQRIGELVKEAIRQTRDLAHGLCPVDFNIDGLRTALLELATYLGKTQNVSVRFTPTTANSIPDESKATQLYIIARELAVSAIRDGGARQVLIVLDTNDFRTVLTVEHNGRTGRNAGKIAETNYMITRHRASLIGATLSVSRREGNWTAVRCRLSHRTG